MKDTAGKKVQNDCSHNEWFHHVISKFNSKRHFLISQISANLMVSNNKRIWVARLVALISATMKLLFPRETCRLQPSPPTKLKAWKKLLKATRKWDIRILTEINQNTSIPQTLWRVCNSASCQIVKPDKFLRETERLTVNELLFLLILEIVVAA